MRCPKCGYISFDHIDACLKCNKNISKVSSKVEGTTYNVAAPSFLKFTPSSASQAEEKSEISFDTASADYDIVDPDLDVLADDNEMEESSADASISFGDEFEGLDSLAEDDNFELETDELVGEEDAGIDLGQFEDAFEEQEAAPLEDDVALNMPDELADLSDLEAPPEEPEPMPEDLPEPASEKDELGDFSLNLDLDELGDDFSLTEKEETGAAEEALGDLSLDDLGLTEEEKEEPVEVDTGDMDMDADLDFDLDLGGISLDKEK